MPAPATSTASTTTTPPAVPARSDVVVIGAGIVGLATARELLRRRPGTTVTVVDKADEIAAHQTGHNSGVIHAGVYYAPGSAKAELCRTGRAAMLAYCAERGVPTEVGGKVVVATERHELDRLDELKRRSEANRLVVHRLDRYGLSQLEPHVRGLAALHVPATGIVDFARVAAALAEDVAALGGQVVLGTAVLGLSDPDSGPVRVSTEGGDIEAGALVSCGGLQADRLARAAGAVADDGGPLPHILPFRGEYHELRADRTHLVRNLVYPVPDPRLPFLGVHLTRDIHGGVHVGPNAVPALGRESYGWGTFVPRDVAELMGYAGTWKLARKFWRNEIGEVTRSLSTRRFVKAVQRLVPDVSEHDLVRAGAGVRAQAVAADGTLLDDFAFASTRRTVHVINAPSPAATASLAIAERIANRLMMR